MNWLCYEMAGSPPYPNFDFWLRIAPVEKNAMLASVRNDPRYQQLEPAACLALAAVDPIFTEIAKMLAALPPLRVDDLAAKYADWRWRKDVLNALDFHDWVGKRAEALTQKISAWHLTRDQEKLFRILDSLKETKVEEGTHEPFPCFENAAVTESYLALHLWDLKLRDLSAPKRKKRLAALRQLQSTLNVKLLENRTGLSVFRPRPKTLGLRWQVPGADERLHPEAEEGQDAVVECLNRLREILQAVPGGWLRATIAHRDLAQRGFVAAEIAAARKQLNVETRREIFGEKAAWTWRLAPGKTPS